MPPNHLRQHRRKSVRDQPRIHKSRTAANGAPSISRNFMTIPNAKPRTHNETVPVKTQVHLEKNPNFIIKKPHSSQDGVSVKGSINEITTEFTIDTSSKYSFISQEEAERYQHLQQPLEEKIIVQNANKQITEVTHT